MKNFTAPCFACGQKLAHAFTDESYNHNQPSGGIAFTSPGHYGTTFFDPSDNTTIEINICDTCLDRNKDKILVNCVNGEKFFNEHSDGCSWVKHGHKE